jgi:4,5-dihydroxyphthalate decarboxylase
MKMSKLPLTFACGLYDRMVPLFAGDVRPEGIDLNFLVIDAPREVFDRMGGHGEFDLAEMSSTEFIMRLTTGDCPFVALPVFPSRVFRHGLIAVNRRSGIKAPKDLEGKRVGVPLYTMTAAVWIRGHLQHEYGVDLSKIHWVQGSINKAGTHGTPNVAPMAKPIRIEIKDPGKTLNEMLEEGSIDAVIGTSLPESTGKDPNIQRLIPDYHTVERRYFERTGIFPIMHLVAIRKEIYERYPFIGTSLYNAFCTSKDIALQKMKTLVSLRYMLPWMTASLDEIEEVFGGDPWPYGIEPNRPTLNALLDYMVEQSLIASKPKLEDIFIPISHA